MERDLKLKRYIPLSERLNAIHHEAFLRWVQADRDAKTKLLATGDPETVEWFLSEWDDAIAANGRIDKFRARTPEEVEEYRQWAKRSVEENRWNLEAERSNEQVVEDGRRTYLAEYRQWQYEKENIWN